MARLVLGTDINNTGTSSIVRDVSPAMYRAFEVGTNGKVVNSKSESFHKLPNNAIDISPCCYYSAYYNTPSNVLYGDIDLSNLTSISGSNACMYMFQGCTGITSVDLSSLVTISGEDACYDMFSGCTNITSANLSSLKKISKEACRGMFMNCNNLSSINLSSLVQIEGASGCYVMFSGCTSLTNIDLSSLEIITTSYGAWDMFRNCTNITDVDLSSLTTVYGYSGCNDTFGGCTSLVNVNLSSLKILRTTSSLSSVCQYMFKDCKSLTELKFPSITTTTFGTQNNQFGGLVSGVTGCTIHFPSNLEPTIQTLTGYPNFGGTDTVLLFDLPATNNLIGNNTIEYERNPKYDTQTALAWRIKDTGKINDPIIDWTPYYTHTLGDPQVGDTIYSDPECTTTLTTIDSIA